MNRFFKAGFAVALAIILAIGVNNCRVNAAAQQVSRSVDVFAYYRFGLQPNVIVFDLRDLDPGTVRWVSAPCLAAAILERYSSPRASARAGVDPPRPGAWNTCPQPHSVATQGRKAGKIVAQQVHSV